MHLQWHRRGSFVGILIAIIALISLVGSDEAGHLTARTAKWISQVEFKIWETEPRSLSSEGGEESPREEEKANDGEEEKSEEPAEGKSAEGESGESEEKEEGEVLETEDLTLAISLLGGIILLMTLYYAVNYDDDDMKYYVWAVISTFMSIFIAIFTFTSIKELLEESILGEEKSEGGKVLLAFGQVSIYFLIVQLSIPQIAGVWGTPFRHANSNMESNQLEKEIKEEREQRRINFKSIASLVAHMCAFSAMDFGGTLQHMPPFNQSVLGRFAIPPLFFIGQLIVGRICRCIRLQVIENRRKPPSHYESLVKQSPSDRMSHSTAGLEWSFHKWDEETYECEVEISGLCNSFLLVQACRFSITNVMPNTLGIEEEGYRHPQSAVYKLLGCSGIFVTLSVINVAVLWHLQFKKISPGTLMSTFRRCCLVMEKTFAVASAWCLLFSGRWQMTIWFVQFPPNGVISRVLLAIAVSALVFFIVVLLDALADHEATTEAVDEAIFAIIAAFSFLVGFSWEQSFDGAVEVLAEDVFRKNKVIAGLLLTIVVVIIVYPAWRKYILHKMLKHKDLYDEKHEKPTNHQPKNKTEEGLELIEHGHAT